MSELKSDTQVLTTKIDAMREDIRRLLPILSLLDPHDRDQMSGFAERLLTFMSDIERNYDQQTSEFAAMRAELRETSQDMRSINEKLRFLIEGS